CLFVCRTLISTLFPYTTLFRSILMVHLYGQITDGHAIRQLCDDFDLLLIEDAAQAHGAIENNKRAGSIGHAAGFSFYPGKNLGRSEEHTSELQSRENLVCRLLL